MVRGVGWFLACLLLMSPSQGRAEDGGPAGVWATVPYFTWVAETSAPVEQFRFLINGAVLGQERVTVVKHQDSLHARLHLTYEQHNLIEVRQGDKVVYRADVFYAPSYEKSIVPPGASYRPFHTAENERPCQPCHRLTLTPEDSAPRQVKEGICYSCHQHKFEGMKSQHKPAVIDWKCLRCHQAEGRKSPWGGEETVRFAIEDRDTVAPLCYQCHEKFAAKVEAYAFQHGPIGMGQCNVCHNPHGSMWPKLLQNNQTTLCVNCHEFREKIAQPVIHQIIKSKGCTPCHDPHGSSYPLQLKEEVPKLCTRCHPALVKQANNHPVQDHPTFIRAEGKGKRPKVSCVDCHAPHAAPFAKLLAEGEMTELCRHCHSMEAK